MSDERKPESKYNKCYPAKQDCTSKAWRQVTVEQTLCTTKHVDQPHAGFWHSSTHNPGISSAIKFNTRAFTLCLSDAPSKCDISGNLVSEQRFVRLSGKTFSSACEYTARQLQPLSLKGLSLHTGLSGSVGRCASQPDFPPVEKAAHFHLSRFPFSTTSITAPQKGPARIT